MVFITFLCRNYYYLDHENEHWYYTFKAQFFQDTFWYQYSHYTIVTNRHINNNNNNNNSLFQTFVHIHNKNIIIRNTYIQ